MTKETPNFTSPTVWLPSSSDKNPVDYKVVSNAGEGQQRADQGRQRTAFVYPVTAWDELDQRVIDTAVRQWHTHLRACFKAKGGHFEHTLSQ